MRGRCGSSCRFDRRFGKKNFFAGRWAAPDWLRVKTKTFTYAVLRIQGRFSTSTSHWYSVNDLRVPVILNDSVPGVSKAEMTEYSRVPGVPKAEND